MPQILSTDVPHFLEWLKKNHGVSIVKTKVKARQINHTQGEINIQKAEAMTSQPDALQKPIIMSDDYYILDGHHRHVAQYILSSNYPTNVFKVVGLGAEDLLEIANTYPKVFRKRIDEFFKEFLKGDCGCGCEGKGVCE